MKTKQLVMLAVMTALATVLMFIEIPNPIAPFLKLDVSDVVILFVFTVYGFKSASAVVVMRGLLHALLKGPDAYSAVPYMGSFVVVVASITLVYAFFVARNKFKLDPLFTSAVMVVSLTVVMTIINYFLVTPLYFGWPTVSLADVQGMFTGFLNWDTGGNFDPASGYLNAVLFAYVPFNFIKAALVSFIYFIIEKPLLNAVK